MNTIIIVAARIDSSRLPGKSVKILHGKPMLEHVLDFLKFSKLTNRIIVATSVLKHDDKIEEICKKSNVDCFRGSPEDVLKRYYECAKIFNGDLIVRVTADNPLVEPELIDRAIKLCSKNNFDYVTNMFHHTYPLGYTVEVMTFEVLKKNHENQHDQLAREHVTYHIRKNPKMYNTGELFAPSGLERSNWRLTVDYIEDFQLIEEIFKKLYRPSRYISYQEVVELLDNNDELLKINEKYLPNKYLY